MSAYCNGRAEVNEYDTLLLKHIFWNQPDEAERIHDWLMKNLAASDENTQVSYLLSGYLPI